MRIRTVIAAAVLAAAATLGVAGTALADPHDNDIVSHVSSNTGVHFGEMVMD
ncbi:hypothetical protein ABT390_28310 [Streptomyces aurantiacus]|uniref:Uncharacterized protein n=1 Tax=Streptomyces aurantiacus JA 4570 TaxID=1286094 RepID=S4A0Z6_9ACTN|nr:hypothetical protein [Streptomyces aurantiacus]EPH44375.1 hypothetical protein STRAU_2575 [Streptomyces aurantiacus JA 4570]